MAPGQLPWVVVCVLLLLVCTDSVDLGDRVGVHKHRHREAKNIEEHAKLKEGRDHVVGHATDMRKRLLEEVDAVISPSPSPSAELSTLELYRIRRTKEFKEMAFNKDIVNVAKGLMLGAAITTLVKALVADIATPFITATLTFASPIGALETNYFILQNGNKNETFYNEKTGYGTLADAVADEAVIVRWGHFLNSCVEFFITLICIFYLHRIYRRAKVGHWSLNGLAAAEEAAAKADEALK